MKKLLRLVLLAALLVPIGARATTDSLTVADGTVSNEYLPIYGYWADADQHNQMVYPASMLTDMVGQNIIGLSFYVTSGSYSCDAVISMAIVSDSTLSGLNTTATLTQVWSGYITGPTMNFEFSSAFEYTGGNLLVDIQTIGGNYSSSSALGISRTGAAYYSYNGSQYSQGFLPKASFVYSDEAFCSAPSGITFDTNSAESITFHWTPGSTESLWQVMVGDSLIDGVNDNNITVNDLNSSSRYPVRVRSICGPDDTSAWSGAVTMQTLCGSITNLPWSYSFEGEADQSVPLCWTRTQALSFNSYDGLNNTPYVYNYNSYAHTGNAALYYYFASYYGTVYSDTGLIASPYIAHNPADLHVTFWVKPSTFPDDVALEGGIIADPTDASTFVPLVNIYSNQFVYDDYMYEYPYTQFEFVTSGLTDFDEDDSVCVAFRIVAGDASYLGLLIDDITVDVLGDCMPPVLNSGNVDSISYNAVQLSWQGVGEDGEYVVMLENEYDHSVSYYDATTSTLLIEGLGSDSTYSAYVATLCDGDTTDYIPLAEFTTHLRCYSVQNAEVAALTANAATLTWQFTGTGIEPASVELVLTDLSDSSATPVEESVTDANTYTFSGLTENHMYQVSFITICGDEGDSSAVVTLSFMPHMPPCAEVAGTNSNNYIPFYSYYNNGFSESLYDASIIAGVDTITGISLEVATPLNRNNLIDIYMGYTTVSSLTTSNYVPVAQLTHVVSDYQLYTGVAGWVDMIPFDTVFVNQPTGDSLNLIIAFYNHTGTYSSGLGWATHTSPIGNSVYGYTDSPIDPANPWTMSEYSMGSLSDAPNVQLYGTCGGGDCLPPSLTLSATDTNSATFTWLPGGSESSWTVQYRVNGSTTWITAGTALTQPYTITGLNAGTEYQFRLGSDCGDTVAFSTPTTGTTACGIATAPISIFPNGENLCWTYTGSGYYSSYDNAYEISSGGAIISPAIADSLNTLQVEVTGYGSDIRLGTCDEGGLNPVWLDTVSFLNATYNNYETRKVRLDGYTGEQHHIIIKALSGSNYTYISKITVNPLDNCLPVENIQLDSVTPNDAWLSWESDGTSFEVQYMAESSTTGAWQSVTVATNSAHLTGLNSNDRYQIKVFNVCSDTTRSDSITLRIATGCTPYPVPYVELFGLADELPVCWNNVTGDPNAQPWSNSAWTGNNYLNSYADYYSTTPADDWLMTPVIQMPTSADYYQLIYYAGGGPNTYTTGSFAAYEVRICTTGSGDTSAYTTLLLTDTVNTYNSNTYNYTLIDQHLSLAAYAGQQVSFAFVNRSRADGVVYLADVEVREAVSPRYYITGNNTAFTGDTGYYYAHYNEGALDSMNRQWTSTMAAAGNAVMTGANTDSMYIVYSAAGIDTITFIAYNQYGADTNMGVVYVYECSPVTEFPFNESFESPIAPVGCWTLVYGDGNPSVNSMIHTNDLGYNLPDSIPDGERVFRFSSMSSKTDYNQYLISRELGGSNMVLSFEYAKYNTNSSESIRVGYSSTNRDTNSFTWGSWITGEDLSCYNWNTFTDTIPNGTKYVAIQYWGNYAYYVYIDNLTITGEGGCPAPVITSVAPGEDNLTINFASEADSVEIVVSEGSFNPDATGVVVSGNNYTATGLTYSELYSIAIRSICGDGSYSDWVVVTDSTLMVNCGVPTNLAATATDYNSISLSWTAAGEELAWEVSLFNTMDTVYVTSTTTSATVTGLVPGTSYSAIVRALCGQNSDIEGDWSVAIPVSTDACEAVEGITVTPGSTTATVNWTATGNTYRVVWGELPFNPQDLSGEATVNTNSYIITGLDPETAYAVVIYNNCAEGLSMASNPVNFTTTAGGGDPTLYTVTVTANNDAWGSVTGSGQYVEGSTATISATANDGYRFVEWDDHNTDNPRTFTVTSNMSFTAIFESTGNGIEDVLAGTVSLYPNPASTSVTLGLEGFEGESQVEVVDMNGRVVIRHEVRDSKLEMNVSELPQGAYFVRVTNATRTAISKLIVK